ncbi:MAG: 16S rRNA methyltransferase, partial [Pseudomonadota bacterium]
RLRRLRENLARTGLTADVVQADLTAWRPAARFDAVLLDAPCSASGTVRRHPELPWIKDASGLTALAAQQDALLDAAWDLLKPGGGLVYCTCSVFKAEGEARIDAFLERHGDGQAMAAAGDGDLSTGAGRDDPGAGRVRTLPSDWATQGGVDGFFCARLRKRPS